MSALQARDRLDLESPRLLLVSEEDERRSVDERGRVVLDPLNGVTESFGLNRPK